MTTETEPRRDEDIPRRERRANQAKPPPDDAAPPARPAAARTKPPRLAPRGPLLLVLALLAGIAELMLFQAPLWVFITVNAVLGLLALVVWRLRRRSRSPRRPRSSRGARGLGRRGRVPGSGLLRSAASRLGLGSGRRGSTPRTGGGSLLSRLGQRLGGRSAGGSRGTRSATGGRSGSTGSRSRGLAGLGSRLAGRRSGGGSSTGSRSRGLSGRRGSSTGSAGGGPAGGPTASRGRGRSRLGGLFSAFRSGTRQGASTAPNPGTQPSPRPKTTSGRPAAPSPTQPKETKDGGEKVGIFKGRSGGGKAAPAGNYYGGNGRYGAGPDDRSLFSAGRSLAHAPEAFEDFAHMLDAWAREFEENQPADLSIPEQIRAAIGVVRSLGADSGDWQANYRRRHEADEQRLNSPARGSRSVEAKRDVRAAHNEGL